MAEPTRLLTPPIISKLPLGLLDFLGIKSGGRYPEALVPALQPTWDLERYQTIHDERNAFDVAAAFGAGALNFSPTTIVVPNTEMWLVMQQNAFLQTDAGETVTSTLGYFDSYNFMNLTSGVVVLAASSQRHFTSNLGVSFLAGPGSIFGFVNDQITTAGTIVAQMFVRYIRFRL